MLAAALALAACSHHEEKPLGQSDMNSMIGLSRAALLDCAGVPAATSRAGDAEYLVYRTERLENVGLLQSVPHIPVIGSVAVGSSGHKVMCEATFVLRGDKVDGVAYRTDPPESPKDTALTCQPIVKACVVPNR